MDKKFLIKNRLIVILIVIMLLMVSFVISAAAQIVSSDVKLANTTDSWDIEFTDMKLLEIKGSASENSKPSYSSTYASFDVTLSSTSDRVKYEITISNLGLLDAKADGIYILPQNTSDNPIKYEISGVNNGDVLKAGEEVKATISIYYEDIPFNSTDRNASILINYVQN